MRTKHAATVLLGMLIVLLAPLHASARNEALDLCKEHAKTRFMSAEAEATREYYEDVANAYDEYADDLEDLLDDTNRDSIKNGRTNARNRLKQELKNVKADFKRAKDDARQQLKRDQDQCKRDHPNTSSNSGNTTGSGACAPYKCKDGTEIARCTAQGFPINYLLDPCHDHGGQKA